LKKVFLLATAAVLSANLIQLPLYAVDGLRITVQGSDVVLSWPTILGQGDTYIVQYRPTLDQSTPWQTLTNSYPASDADNFTVFVHSNIVKTVNYSGAGASMVSVQNISAEPAASEPLVVTTDGSGAALPLIIYPPGFNFSGFIIFDPSTGEQVSGTEFTRTSSSLAVSSRINVNATDLTPPDYGGGTNNQTSQVATPDTGFYRVAQTGIHIYGLTNGAVLSGTVQFPIELGLNSSNEIVGVVFYDENKDPIAGAKAVGTNNCWTMVWDTKQAFNGSYDIYAKVFFAGDDSVASIPHTVTVSNTISFPLNFTRFFGSQMWVFAQTIPNSVYQIEMYDQNTNYVGTFSGNADGYGYISFIWSLQNRSGQVLTDTNFFGIFTVNTSSMSGTTSMSLRSAGGKRSGSIQDFLNVSPAIKTFNTSLQAQSQTIMASADFTGDQAPEKWSKEKSWFPGNGFVIAYSPLTDNTSTTDKIRKMMIGGDGGLYGGVVSTLGLYGLGFRMSPGNISQTSAFIMNDGNSRSNLLSYLSGDDPSGDYRHFYFFGHGDDTCFGCASYPMIAACELQIYLKNEWILEEKVPEHPYKFVMIDACESAAGGALCRTFGIPPQTINDLCFINAGIQPRAYVGYKDKSVFTPNDWDWNSMMLGGFFNDWMNGYTLQECMDRAKNGTSTSGNFLMESSAVIFGATDLKISD